MTENVKLDSKKWSPAAILIAVLSFAMIVFHIATVQIIVHGYIQSAIHWMLIATINVLAKPSKFKGGLIFDCVLILAIIYISIHVIELQTRLFTTFRYTNIDRGVSVAAIIIALFLGFKVLGKILPVICILFFLYALYGNNIQGMFRTANMSFMRVSTTVLTQGLFGPTLEVSAKFLLLFIFFGALMEISGSGEFFVDLVSSFTGRVRGGPAQAAVYSSMLMGMVNGSGPANVATTGTFTIPLMKKMGYHASFAGAVEAVASTGGQVMPPVMGAVAFLMSEITGIPYATIAISALVPASLYYLALSTSVYGAARRNNMKTQDPATLPNFFETLKNGWYYLIPMIVIVVLIFNRRSPQRAVFWAIASNFGVILLFKREALRPKYFIEACVNAAKSCGPIAMACMLAGIIMCVINITGLGLNITTIIGRISGGSLVITLFMTMTAALLLGMGLPTSAAYIVLSVLIAPALMSMGVTRLAAHLFVLYFGILSGITPPVALSVFTAVGISGAGIWETGRDAIKLASAGFIVPFIFVYSNELLLIGSAGNIVIAVLTAVLGCMILGFSISGWCVEDMYMISRILLFPCAIATIMVRPLWLNGLGIALAAIIIAVNCYVFRSMNKKATA